MAGAETAAAAELALTLEGCAGRCRTASKSLDGAVWNRYRSEHKYCNGSGEQIGSQSKLVSQKRSPRPAQERLEQSRAELHGLTSQVEAMRKEAAEAARERAQILAAVQELRGMLGKPAGGQSPTGGTGGLNA